MVDEVEVVGADGQHRAHDATAAGESGRVRVEDRERRADGLEAAAETAAPKPGTTSVVLVGLESGELLVDVNGTVVPANPLLRVVQLSLTYAEQGLLKFAELEPDQQRTDHGRAAQLLDQTSSSLTQTSGALLQRLSNLQA